MMTPLFQLTLPNESAEAHFAPLQITLRGLCDVNQWHIERMMKRLAKGMTPEFIIPPLYASGVVYKEDDPGHEDWSDAIETHKKQVGDCKKLVAWRVAEQRANGVECEPVIKWQFIPRDLAVQLGYPAWLVKGDGLWLVHCQVRYSNGTIEDPSKILGMGGDYNNKS